MSDPSYICDHKQDAYGDMSDGPEDMPVIDELAEACRAADAWFRKRHDIGTELPNHYALWLQLCRALRRYKHDKSKA